MNVSEIKTYASERNRIINDETKLFLGEKLSLNETERELNELLLDAKSAELKSSYENSEKFLSKKHFFNTKNQIEKSKVFKILRNLAKGHSLHTHLLSASSVEFIVKKITYWENLYGKNIDNVFKIKFMKQAEADKDGWVSFQKLREEDKNFDEKLRKQFSLVVENPEEKYTTLEQIWAKFKATFSAVYDMLSYKPAFETFYYQCLKELYDDNLTYGEFRGTVMPLYDFENTRYTKEDFFALLERVGDNFKENHADFFGSKYIHSIYRGASLDVVKEEISSIIDMKKKFPNLIAGIDFVGFEETGHPLVHFQEDLAGINGLDLFFHAGETNWFGHTDTNLIDAVLMKAKRIGHACAITKHPILMEYIKKNDIAVEHCPISNQVLLLISDPRTHPITTLLSQGFPVVVCNDDPGSWGATGLSYDFYVTFMSMTPQTCGLKFLKQLAINSIEYSAMDATGKKQAMDLWERQWNALVSKETQRLKMEKFL